MSTLTEDYFQDSYGKGISSCGNFDGLGGPESTVWSMFLKLHFRFSRTRYQA